PYISLKNVNIRDRSTTGSFSFPSGHTSVAFSMATSLTLRYPDKPLLITGLYIYAAAVGFGRVYSGVHYPTDILAGIATGVGSSVLIYSLRKQIVDLKNNIVNEKGREDQNSSITSEPLLLFSLLLTDYINTLFSGNNSKLISNSQLKINFTGNSSYTQYSLFF
ncbi:phosphatase PAP2 family protein, partial [bacterium]